MRRILPMLGVALAASCGGTPANSVAPSPNLPPPSSERPAGTVLAISSLTSGQPVAGAVLTTAAGAQFHGDGTGGITLTSTLPRSSVVTIGAPNFLDRKTVLSNHPGFALWPRTDAATGLTEEFTRDVVFGGNCGMNASRPMLRLHPTVRQVFIAPTADIMAQTEAPQPWAMSAREAHERAVAELNRVLAPGVRFELVAQPPVSGFVVRVTVGPTSHVCTTASAFASFTAVGRGDIIDGTINHCGLTTPENRNFGTANLPSVVLHEMGHIIGLSHSNDIRDAMFTTACPAPTGSEFGLFEDTYSARERQVLRMMLQRSAGSVFPDDDSAFAVPVTASGRRTIVVH